MTQTPLPLPLPSDLRNGAVIGYGPGHPRVFLRVLIDGIAEPQSVLAPPREIPAIVDRIAVRAQDSGEWTFAGRPM